MDFSANMNFAMFVRRPFVVEAVEVTIDNIEEISKHVGKCSGTVDDQH